MAERRREAGDPIAALLLGERLNVAVELTREIGALGGGKLRVRDELLTGREAIGAAQPSRSS